MSGDIWVLRGSGEVLYNVHREGQCVGFWCTIHNPMPGPWANWPMTFGYDGMFRVCPHGFRHNAVEDMINGFTWGIHECDGCDCGFDSPGPLGLGTRPGS